jgi:RNA recognition motif-containing protein
MTLYVGNIPYSMKEEDIESVFKEFGNVVSVKVIIDRATRRSKGYGFVEMESEEQAEAAMKELDGKDFSGRNLKVSKANPKTEKDE